MPQVPPRPPKRKGLNAMIELSGASTVPGNVQDLAAKFNNPSVQQGYAMPAVPKLQHDVRGSGRLEIPTFGGDSSYTKPRSASTFNFLPEGISRGEQSDIDWRICKVAWILNQAANLPYFITLAMCFTTKGKINTKPLFDSKHVTFFIWAMMLIVVNTWVTGNVIWFSLNRTIRQIAWAQGAAFIVMNLSLMMVVHNGTFVDLDTEGIEYIKVNVYYAGPPEVASQLILWTSLMGLFSCKSCCPPPTVSKV